MVEWYSQEKARSHDCYLAFGCWAGWRNTCVRPRVESTAMFKKQRRINEFLLPGVLPLVQGPGMLHFTPDSAQGQQDRGNRERWVRDSPEPPHATSSTAARS